MTKDEIKKQIIENIFKNGIKSWDFISEPYKKRCVRYHSEDFRTPYYLSFNNTKYHFISMFGFEGNYSIEFVSDYSECSLGFLLKNGGQNFIDFLKAEKYIK